MKKLFYLILLLSSFITNGQEATISLSGSQPSGTVSEATNSITLLPGFSTQGNYIARIVEENWYNAVVGNPYNLNENLNWISSNSYDLAGNLTSAGVSYFNTLGKGTQSQSLDIKTGEIWANEVRYDEFGRPIFSTLSAPIGENYGFKNDFIKKNNGNTLSAADIQNLTSNSSTVSISDEEDTLGWYYSEANDSEEYQDITSYPFSKTIYSTLNPGLGLRTLGGNKIKKTPTSQEEWLQSYSFSMPMAQELFYAFGTDYFPTRTSVENASEISKQPYYIQGSKTVVRDVNGVESVIFKSSDGNVLAAARSGNEESDPKKYKVLSPIGVQGYVDIHIPVGCDGTVYFKGPSNARFKIYDLILDLPVSGKTNVGSSTFLNSGMYRIEEISSQEYHKNINPYATISSSTIKLLDNSFNVGVEYQVNYYDYSLNYYDKAGRLTSSVQPLGFDAALNLQATREHTLIATFAYNSLGQLLETESPDEGFAEFKYRKDGQIRFSQNSKQKIEGEFSYTNYDPLGRPVESGVAVGGIFNFNLDPETLAFSSTSKKEQHFTVYDIADPTLNTILNSENIPNLYKQKFLAGNVAKTYTRNPSTTATWYGYDVYGRVTWMLQNIDGLGVKTIDYEYDFATGQVTKVLYQKYHTPQKGLTDETFIHQYTYNIAGELYKVETSTDNTNYTEQAKYKYYETGALKRVEVAENVQGIDYIYNLNGQLKAINHPSTNTNEDPSKDGNNGIAKDLFGFALDYYNGDYSRTNTPTQVTSTTQGTNQFNGNIKATRWATSGINNSAQAAQLFTYNKNNWLQQADFGSAQNNGQITVGNDYKVSNITYDINGNIKTLNRNKDSQSGNNAMDVFTYNYKTDKPNQLEYVEDAVTAPTNANDLKTQTPNNYIYNQIGQLVFNRQDQITYTYNASGLVTNIGQVVNDAPSYPSPAPFTLFTNTFNSFIPDFIDFENLGATWRVVGKGKTSKTNFKSKKCSDMLVYGNVAEISLTASGIRDGSVKSSKLEKSFNVIAEKNHTFSVDLIREKMGLIGPPKDISISDLSFPTIQHPLRLVVKTESGTVLASTIIDALSSFPICDNFAVQNAAVSFTPPANTTSVKIYVEHYIEGTANFYIDNTKLTVLSKPTVDFTYNDKGFRVKKRVYVGAYSKDTYYVRDAAGSPMAIVNMPVGKTTNKPTLEYPIYGASRLGIYNKQSNTSVYQFTDHLGNVRAVASKTPEGIVSLSSATDYYPFGMPMPNRQIVGGEPYRYAYQGQEKDPETGNEAFQLRLWDGRIGRWLNPDPGKEFHSPYLGMGNNPTKYIDKKGDSIFIYGINGGLQKIHDNVLATSIGAKVINKYANSSNRHIHLIWAELSGLHANAATFRSSNPLWFREGMITEHNIRNYGAFKNVQKNNFFDIKFRNGRNIIVAMQSFSDNSLERQEQSYFHELKAHVDGFYKNGNSLSKDNGQSSWLSIGIRDHMNFSGQMEGHNDPSKLIQHLTLFDPFHLGFAGRYPLYQFKVQQANNKGKRLKGYKGLAD
jgi:RHS repeat-associated protein